MTITITADEPRSIKAIQIAAGASQWLRCQTRHGHTAYGVPSQCQPGRYYLVDVESCDCPDFQRSGLSTARIGHPGVHAPCKHVLGVRLHLELVKAQEQAREQRRGRRRRLSVVRTPGDLADDARAEAAADQAYAGLVAGAPIADGADIFRRFDGE